MGRVYRGAEFDGAEKNVGDILEMRQYETDLHKQGYTKISGVDEAGRGCLAGAVFAAAVVIPYGKLDEYISMGVNDSKKISEKKRNELFEYIKQTCSCYAVGIVEPDEIDEINIYQAAQKAMCLAIEAIDTDFLLTDHMPIPMNYQQLNLVKGDQKSVSIAAASIIAKVSRDKYMEENDALFPEYGFAKHKGYPTKAHYEAIKEFGITPLHRRSFNLFS
jgi:ribonuclease HII